MVMLRSIFELIPNTWEIQFASQEVAHADFDATFVKYDQKKFGAITVFGNSWYIGTKLTDSEFENDLSTFLTEENIPTTAYSMNKTTIGKHWMPY
ncbi:hypothetical protein [Companilactobacillus kimchiensis]|nr:hypothetical protein [Companilactobacillus kimchiensis]